MPLEARQAVLGRKVGRAVDGRDIFEHRGLDLRVGQREGLQLDGDVDGCARHGEVLAVELIAVGEH